MLERAIVAHGAPTLAGLKLGSLFNVALAELRVLEEEMQMLNAVLLPKGVALALLSTDAQRALLYLYRTSTLFQELQREEVRAFLRQWGYQRFSPEEALAHLRERVAAAGSFPHEIGVFLGYPLSDVQEFIRSSGRNCLLSGYWKVYSNADAAREIFARYRKCTDVYLRRFQDGFSLSRLTVCAKKAA